MRKRTGRRPRGAHGSVTGGRAPAAADGMEQSPAAERVATPRWRDIRLLIGLVLVLASVLLGIRAVGAADHSVSVWALSRDLAAGSVLSADDLVVVDVRFGTDAAGYLAASAEPAGQIINRDLAAGELLPVSALGERADVVSLALAVPAQRVPQSVRRGVRINVYASAAETSKEASGTTLIAASVTVLEITGRSSGALSVGSADIQVVISVPACAVPAILDASHGRLLSVATVSAPAATKPEGC